MDKTLAQKHYAIHKDKDFFNDLVEFITSTPIIAAVFEGERAIEAIRQTMGATDPLKAASGSVRGDFGLDIQQNLVHGSDSAENAEREIGLFFSPGEIFN
jgi:nucleoside-diphosphate kinase